MRFYQPPPRALNSRLHDPLTGAPVWPLRIVERHLSTPAPSQTPPATPVRPETKGAAVGAAAPEGNM